MSRRKQAKRRLLFFVASLFLCIGVLSGRAIWEGRSALARGDAELAEGNVDGAVRWWRRAARWYVPLAPHVPAAYEKLRTLATEAEGRGERETALLAWRGIRSSARATRSIIMPYRAQGDEADAHIATLMAANDVASGAETDAAAAEAWHLSLLQRSQIPSTGWTIVALLGLALWIGGGFAFAARGVDERAKLVPRAAAYSGAAVSAGLVLWLLGLALA